MIELKQVSKKYGSAKNYSLKTTDLVVPSGRIVGFIGHNGAGKSTTLNMISGILEPTTGEILVNGVSVIKDPIRAKQEMAFVPDNPDVFLKLTGYEYLNFIGNAYNVEPTVLKERIEKLAKEYLLEDRLNELIDSYSHGMRQKIVVMGALVHEPKVLLLDEPLTGLDPQAAKILKESMASHANKGNTVFFSTHVLEVAEKLCDEIVIVNKGEVIFQGTLDALKEQYKNEFSLEDIFLDITSKNVQ